MRSCAWNQNEITSRAFASSTFAKGRRYAVASGSPPLTGIGSVITTSSSFTHPTFPFLFSIPRTRTVHVVARSKCVPHHNAPHHKHHNAPHHTTNEQNSSNIKRENRKDKEKRQDKPTSTHTYHTQAHTQMYVLLQVRWRVRLPGHDGLMYFGRFGSHENHQG